MYSILFLIFLAVLGAMGGYVGVIGEPFLLTDKSMRTAIWQGGSFCVIVSLGILDLCPDHITLAVIAGFFFGILRWYLVEPVCNVLLKILYDMAYVIIAKVKSR